MSYTPTTWAAGDTVTSAKLNKIEQGIADIQGIKVVQANITERNVEKFLDNNQLALVEYHVITLEITPNELKEIFDNKQIIFVFSPSTTTDFNTLISSRLLGIITRYEEFQTDDPELYNMICYLTPFQPIGLQSTGEIQLSFESSGSNDYFVYSDDPDYYNEEEPPTE